MSKLVDWTETKLWVSLKGKDDALAEAARLFCQSLLPKAQSITQSSAGSSRHFTLHDAQHSFRVAESMAKIVGANALDSLSSVEIALLLSSAYLHDIGMSPPLAYTDMARSLVLYGQIGDVPSHFSPEEAHDEVALLREWCLRHEPRIDVPESSDSQTVSQQRQHSAEEWIADYCRDSHNRWSSVWTRKHCVTLDEPYKGLVDDLVTLCESHHFGYAALVGDAFNPRVVRGNLIVHLRYLACVLRLADVLENDPERTPDAIRRHNAVRPSSQIFWHKDHEFYVEDTEEGGKIIFAINSKPSSALLMRAVLETASYIEAELRLCDQLSRVTAFDSQTANGIPLQAYEWRVGAILRREISPRNSEFVYIDGSLRPRADRVLSILGGTALYSDELAAIRELIQNAIDATLVQYGYERLSKNPPSLHKWEEIILSNLPIRLRMWTEDGSIWLECDDFGIGMTQKTFEHGVLRPGRSHRPELPSLLQKCNNHGFQLNVTGQFGIGFLSYFMIAEQVRIETARSHWALENGKHENWTFCINGLSDFAELRPNRVMRQHGTSVRLRISAHHSSEGLEGFAKRVRTYLLDTIQRTPVEVNFSVDGYPSLDLTFQRGWSCTIEGAHNLLCGGTDPADPALFVLEEFWGSRLPSELLTVNEQKESLSEAFKLIVDECRSSLKFEQVEGELPSKRGRFLVLVPHFEYASGRSRLFIPTGGHPTRNRPGEFVAWQPSGLVRVSWKGMRVPSSEPMVAALLVHDDESWLRRRDYDAPVPQALVFLDFQSDFVGQLQASRQAINLESPGREDVRAVRQALVRAIESTYRCCARAPGLEAAELSAHWGGIDIPYPEAISAAWPDPTRGAGEALRFDTPVEFSDDDDERFADSMPSGIVGICERLDHYLYGRMTRQGVSWPTRVTSPSQLKLTALPDGGFSLSGRYVSETGEFRCGPPGTLLYDFPEAWSEIVYCPVGDGIWNRGHKLLVEPFERRASRFPPRALLEMLNQPVATIVRRGEAVSSFRRLLAFSTEDMVRLWEGLRKRYPDWLDELATAALGQAWTSQTRLLTLSQQLHGDRVTAFCITRDWSGPLDDDATKRILMAGVGESLLYNPFPWEQASPVMSVADPV